MKYIMYIIHSMRGAFLNMVNYISCNKCGEKIIFMRRAGANIGLYCGGCGKWIQWLGKKDITQFKSRGYIINDESYQPPLLQSTHKTETNLGTSSRGTNVKDKDLLTYCEKCGRVDLYLLHVGNNTGLYCADCNSWITWISKKLIPMYEKAGVNFETNFKKESENINTTSQEITDIVDNAEKELELEEISSTGEVFIQVFDNVVSVYEKETNRMLVSYKVK